MSEYVEVFRVEAKSLLKNFQKHEKEAIADAKGCLATGRICR